MKGRSGRVRGSPANLDDLDDLDRLDDLDHLDDFDHLKVGRHLKEDAPLRAAGQPMRSGMKR